MKEQDSENGILKIEQCTTSEQALEVCMEEVLRNLKKYKPLRLSKRDRNKKRGISERDIKVIASERSWSDGSIVKR